MISYRVGTQYILESILTYWATNKNNVYTWTVFTVYRKISYPCSYLILTISKCGCESWTIKKAECQRIDAFELWCWKRLLRVTWIARTFNQSILKDINPEYSLEGLMLELKLQSFGHLMRRELTHWKRSWCWERLRAGGEGDNGRWDGWMASPTQWTCIWANSRRQWRTGKPGMLQSMGCKVSDMT